MFERDFYISYDGQRERTCRIPRQITKYLPDTDALTFQENFMGGCWPEAVSTRDLLRQHGFVHYTETITSDDRPENGGIFIASRWPILETSSHVYANFLDGKFDQFSAKGVVYAKVEKTVGGQARIYHLTGTHLQAGGGIEGDDIRVRQCEEAREFLDNMTIPADEPLIMAGDYNTALWREPQEMQRILTALRATVAQPIGKQNATSDHGLNDIKNDSTSVDKPSKWLDHVFYADDNLQPSSATMEAIILTADAKFDVCWCELCVPLNEYIYPDDPRCDWVRNVAHLSDHQPVKGTLIFA